MDIQPVSAPCESVLQALRPIASSLPRASDDMLPILALLIDMVLGAIEPPDRTTCLERIDFDITIAFRAIRQELQPLSIEP